MKEFLLELVFSLAVGAASGIHKDGDQVYIVSDNSGYVYVHNTKDKTTNKTALYDGASDITPKKQKKDFESMAAKGNHLYIFGSGSKSKRQTGYTFDLKKRESAAVNLAPLYQRMKSVAQVGKDDFNIEGAIFYKKQLLMFQRGNGPAGKNGIYTIKDAGKFPESEDIAFTEVSLPYIEGVPAYFSDATLVEDKIYFLAAAEGLKSTYNDGQIFGTLLGILDAKTLSVERVVVIGKGKYEGITLEKKHRDRLEFLICEDNDKNETEAGVYKLTLYN